MNTVASDDACLSIKAKHIGPIMELEGKLSLKGQNLLFATSGTGKSFISRALRALDGPIEEGEKDIDPADVVSEESTDGALSLLEGTTEITKITFDKTFGLITRSPSQIHLPCLLVRLRRCRVGEPILRTRRRHRSPDHPR